MAKFTLLEVHLDDATLTANAPYSGESGSETGESSIEASESAAGEEDEGPSVVPPLVALAALVAVAVAVRKLVGEGAESNGTPEAPAIE